MKSKPELVIAYMIRLKNSGVLSVHRSEIMLYMKSIGISDCENTIEYLIREKSVLCLKSEKLTLNLVKLKKKEIV